MSLFKEKNNKKKDSIKINKTIDAIHNELINDINIEKNNLDSYNSKLIEIDKELNKYDNKKYKNDDDIIKYKNLQLKKKEINKNINEINNKEKDYYLNTSSLLFCYYDNNNSSNIVNFFNKSNNKYETMDKSNIIKDYLSITNNEILNKDNYIKKIDINICNICNVEKKILQSEGKLICEQCGIMSDILLDSDKPSYKEPPKEIVYFAYKRINHFNEWLAQFQAKESTDIPKEVYDKIILELKKERINNIALISNIKLREILKKLKLNKYYEHIPHIINRLNGLPPKTMTNNMEQKLRQLFKDIQYPWIKFCPPERKNFLSYSYVLHKFCELLEYDDFLDKFPLLKSREKLHQQDLIWKNICEYLNWEFIKSI